MVKFTATIKQLEEIDHLDLSLLFPDYGSIKDDIFKYFTLDKNIYFDMITKLIVKLYHKRIVSYIYGYDKKWYVYEKHHWQSCDKLTIKKFLEDFVINYANHYNKYYTRQLNITLETIKKEEKDVDIKKYLLIHKSDIDKLIGITKYMVYDMGNQQSIDILYEKCERGLYNEKFQYNCNSNRVLCFKNCVIECDTGVIRHGKPSDYCTWSTDIEYESYTRRSSKEGNFISVEDDSYLDKKNRLNMYLEEVFLDVKDRNNFIDQLVYGLFDINLERKPIENVLEKQGFNLPVFLVHKSSSGLTTLLNFIRNCFGEYVDHLPIISYDKDVETNVFSNEYIRSCYGKRIFFLRREGDIEEIFRTNTFVEGVNYKVFIISKMYDMWEDLQNKPKLAGFTQIKLESTFIEERRDKRGLVPVARENQILIKTFHRNPNMLNDMDDLKSVFIDLLLERRKELMD